MSTDQQQVSVSVDVQASPETVWGLLSRLERMGEWSPECVAVKWAGSAPGPGGPTIGATFKGNNKIGVRRWSTKGTIVAADPNRQLAWDVSAMGLPIARWSYTIEPRDAGCRVTETFLDKRYAFMDKLGGVLTGVKDRISHNEAGMRKTLDNLKSAAEARADT